MKEGSHPDVSDGSCDDIGLDGHLSKLAKSMKPREALTGSLKVNQNMKKSINKADASDDDDGDTADEKPAALLLKKQKEFHEKGANKGKHAREKRKNKKKAK